MCADLRGNDIELKGGDLKSLDRQGSSFYFTVDTCSNMAKVLGETGENCKPNQESLDSLKFVAVDWKLANQFFSSGTYVDNQERLSYAFWTHSSELSATVSSRQLFRVARNSISFKNSYFYNSFLTEGTLITTYTPELTATYTYPTSDI